jgi:hypothetical protein
VRDNGITQLPIQAKEKLVSAGTDLQILKQESQQLKEAIQVQEELRNAHQRRFDKTAAILQVILPEFLMSKKDTDPYLFSP